MQLTRSTGWWRRE